MAKPITLTKAKKKAWDAFSVYIRTRDCIRFRNSLDEGICVTCNRVYPFKSLQAGHFIGGRTNALLFDERIVYTQCYSCNIGGGGSYVEYFIFMEREWGREMIDEFRRLKFKTVKFKIYQLLEMVDEFNTRTNQLKEDFENASKKSISKTSNS